MKTKRKQTENVTVNVLTDGYTRHDGTCSLRISKLCVRPVAACRPVTVRRRAAVPSQAVRHGARKTIGRTNERKNWSTRNGTGRRTAGNVFDSTGCGPCHTIIIAVTRTYDGWMLKRISLTRCVRQNAGGTSATCPVFADRLPRGLQRSARVAPVVPAHPRGSSAVASGFGFCATLNECYVPPSPSPPPPTSTDDDLLMIIIIIITFKRFSDRRGGANDFLL